MFSGGIEKENGIKWVSSMSNLPVLVILLYFSEEGSAKDFGQFFR